MRRSGNINYQRLSASTTLNISTAYYHEDKESENVLMLSYYTSLFTGTSVIDPRLTEEELYMIFVGTMWKKGGCTYPWVSIVSSE